jgi:hypothetical protein
VKILFIGNINHHQYLNAHAKWLKTKLGDDTLIDIFSTNPLSAINQHIKFNFNTVFYSFQYSFLASIPGFKRHVLMPLQFAKLKGNYDVIQVHNISPFLTNISPMFHKKAKVVISSVWGSDFYKSTPKMRRKIGKVLFQHSDAITLGNPEMIQDFKDYYKNENKPIYLCYFGNEITDNIAEIKSQGKEKSKEIFGINPNKICVSIGYNSHPNNQHLLILDAIERSEKLKKIHNRILLILPLTYGGSETYIKLVKERIQLLPFEVIIIDSFLDEVKIAHLRLASDIMINLPISDGLSGSMREHLFAENIIITGSWLPYSLLTKKQIYFHSIDNINELPEKLASCVSNWKHELNNVINNPEKVKEISSWSIVIDDWIKLYNSF